MNHFKYKKNLSKRIVAALIDCFVYFLMFYVYLQLFGEFEDDGSLAVKGWSALPLVVIWLIYFVLIEGTQGGTLGHLVLGLKVVKQNRREIGVADAFLRHLLDPIDIYFWGIVALITINFSEKHQRLGDLVAKTIVVDISDPEQYEEKSIAQKMNE